MSIDIFIVAKIAIIFIRHKKEIYFKSVIKKKGPLHREPFQNN